MIFRKNLFLIGYFSFINLHLFFLHLFVFFFFLLILFLFQFNNHYQVELNERYKNIKKQFHNYFISSYSTNLKISGKMKLINKKRQLNKIFLSEKIY